MNKKEVLYRKLGIPEGYYCYTRVSPIYKIAKDGEKYIIGHYLKYCPFWYGFRPNGGCMIYGCDAGLGVACKACDFLHPTEPPF